MKEKILKMLIDSDGYVSGQQLSDSLGISRTAIWKHIGALRESGYEIESKTSSGYRLVRRPGHMNREEIALAVHKVTALFEDVLYFDSVDSTNLVAKQSQDRKNALIVANQQTAGRGRLGRPWTSEHEQGIYMTMKLHPDLLPSEAVHMTQLTALAVVEALKGLYGLEFKIKWPNDIVYEGRKLVGILTEMSTEIDRIEQLLIGIGINVFQEAFDEELIDKAVSLRQVLGGGEISRVAIIAAIAESFTQLFEGYMEERSLGFAQEKLNACSSLIGREVVVLERGRAQNFRAIEIDGEGQLIVEDAQGKRQALIYGEVSVRGKESYGE